MNRSKQITERSTTVEINEIALPTAIGYTHKFFIFSNFLFFMIFEISVVFVANAAFWVGLHLLKRRLFFFFFQNG